MAISTIPPLSLAAGFLPAPVPPLQQVTQQGALQSFVQQVLTPPAPSTSTLAPVGAGQQLLTSLEQALFRDVLGNIQQAELTSIAPNIEQILTGQFGLSATVGGDLLPLTLQANPASSMVLNASLASLFQTIELLGGAAGEDQPLGSLLNVFA